MQMVNPCAARSEKNVSKSDCQFPCGLVHCPALSGRPHVSLATHSRGLLFWSVKYPAPGVPARPVMYGSAEAGSVADGTGGGDGVGVGVGSGDGVGSGVGRGGRL